MTQSFANLPAAALLALYTALAADKTSEGAKAGVQALNEVAGALNKMYDVVDVTCGDDTDAGVSEWIAADADVAQGVIACMTVATLDLTDNALATAKGSAVAKYDMYVISGADAVVYLGTNANKVPFPMTDQTADTFG